MEAVLVRPESVVVTPSKARRLVGRLVTAVPVLFLAFDASTKVAKIQPVIESFRELGYSPSLSRGIGLLELALLAVYAFPRSAVVGAVLWTGYLGGAVATHVRIESPLFSHVLFPVYVAILLWVGLFLRDSRVSALLRVGR